MDYTPHTEADVEQMLATIGVSSIEELFSHVPENLRFGRSLHIGDPLSESEVLDLVTGLAARNTATDQLVCFAGGGAYDHYVPAATRALAGRSEFMTSYTPYQPELSQGVLGAVFDYQSMICEITGMEVAGSGIYDGATALAEAVHLAAVVTGRTKAVVSQALNPNYRGVLDTLGLSRGYEFVTAAAPEGVTQLPDLTGAACLVIGQPNFFGCIEDVKAAGEAARAAGALLIVHFDPLAMGLLQSPGAQGADVVTGEGQCLGNELTFGGPYLGILATHSEHMRRMPGRICGATVDTNGKPGFVLTLQTREQHIRREKANSNICTDQTLMAVTAATYLSWLGPQGLKELSQSCFDLAGYAAELTGALPGCRLKFSSPFFKEFVLELAGDAKSAIAAMAGRGYLLGPSLASFRGMENCLLVAVTERRTADQIEQMAKTLGEVLA
jgi:glycine dehydrogenase subunit 1